MSDEPTTFKIPVAWIKVAIPYLITALLAATGASKYLEGDVAAVNTGALNRSEVNAHEVQWAISEIIIMRAELKELKERLP